jgi:hypothetical protein
MPTRYSIDEDRIVAEVLESEVMVVNLDNGYYYALEGTGADLWGCLSAGRSAAETAEVLVRRYNGDPAEIEVAVRDFVAQLVAEDLLQPAPADASSPALEVDEGAKVAEPRPAFTLPAMYKYTDMANLVQMDPIRDFEERSWPRRRKKT